MFYVRPDSDFGFNWLSCLSSPGTIFEQCNAVQLEGFLPLFPSFQVSHCYVKTSPVKIESSQPPQSSVSCTKYRWCNSFEVLTNMNKFTLNKYRVILSPAGDFIGIYILTWIMEDPEIPLFVVI
jgi:hypothetical protein